MLQKAFAVLLALLILFALVPTAFAEDEITIIDTAEETEDAELIVLAEPNASVTITVQPEDAEVPEGGTAVFHVEAKAAAGVELSYVWQYLSDPTWHFCDCASGSGMQTDTYQVEAKLYRNTYQYRCQVFADGVLAATSREATLTVTPDPDWPRVFSTGTVEVHAVLDETARIAISATGRDLKYQWEYLTRDSSAWYNCSGESAKTPELQVEALRYRNWYRYRCRVYNDLGSVYSQTFYLIINDWPVPPHAEIEEGAVTARLGETASFRVNARGADLHYQWYWRANSDSSWSRCTGTNCDYRVYNVTASAYRNGYQYRCKVYNDGGYVYTGPATLTVVTPDVPQITRQPQSHTQIKGKNAYFMVEAAGEGLRFQWQYRTGSSGSWSNCSGSSATSSVKLITAYAYRDGYQYRCKVYNGAGAVYSAPVTLTVVDAGPIVITRQPESVTLDKWGVVSLRVEADCAEDYRWYSRAPGGDWELLLAGYPICSSVPSNHYEYVCLLVQGQPQLYSDVVTVSWPDG